MEVECGLPFCFKCKCFPKVMDYPPFEHVVEVVDDPLLVEVLIYIFLGHVYFKRKNNFVHGRSFVALRHMQ